MMSTFPAMSTSDGFFGTPFPAFEGGFTPWDCPEPLFVLPYEIEQVLSSPKPQEPVMSNSGSDNSNPKHVVSNSSSGSDEPNRPLKKCRSGSDDHPVRAASVDERKRRRMISNRESARRSRMRKQKHLENMRNQVNRLRIGNRELMNRFRYATHHCQIVARDNDRLRSESAMLRQKLWDLHQVLRVRQLQPFALSAWPCNNTVTSMDEQNPPSLITQVNHKNHFDH